MNQSFLAKKGCRFIGAMAAAAAVMGLSVNSVYAEPIAPGSLRAPKEAAYAGTGTADDPYRIAISGNVNGSTSFTAPSAFWSGGGVSGGSGIMDSAVVFENYEGNDTDNKLNSSMYFDFSDKDNLTDVWDGTWTYAFRLAPWTHFEVVDDELCLGFSWKGDFSTYFTDWEFTFDAEGLSDSLEEDKQFEPGDLISLTYYGAYDTTQTSRGTKYAVDLTVEDENASSVVYATVDENGYATFSGDNMIVYGGNYVVRHVSEAQSIEVTNDNNNQITEKNGTLQMKASVLPEDALDKDVTWSIVKGGDKAVIDENGLVTAVSDGEIVVRATLTSDPSIYGECTILISGQSSEMTDPTETPDSPNTPETPGTAGDDVNAPDTTKPADTDSVEQVAAPRTGDSAWGLQYEIILLAAAACFAAVLIRMPGKNK